MTASPRDLLSLASRLGALSIAVVGDLMLDDYLEGAVRRISPEAPVPVVRVQRQFHRLGGAANVARAVTTLGAQATLHGVVGKDAPGDDLVATCELARVGVRGVVVHDARPTTRKLRILAQHQQVLRLDWEDASAIDARTAEALLGGLRGAERTSAIIASDYSKGVLTDLTIRGLVDHARTHGVPLLVDPKSEDYSRYRGATVVTPNAHELEVAAGRAIDPADDVALEAAARTLLAKAEIEAMVVTRGERGMLVVPREGAAIRIAAVAREVFDVTGAGDTAIAVTALGLGAGMSLATAVTLANAAAGVVVGKVGTADVTLAELAAALPGARTTSKVLRHEELAERIAWWRLQKKTIVFTNGCYDLVHAGHLSLLRSAAALGDVLLVGLNSDASVRRLKGAERPLIGEDERAEMLASIESVGAVVLFEEDTPLALIEQIRPDVLVKGADYRVEQVVGREAVEAHGGRVELVPLVPGRSTTDIIGRIRSSRS